MLRSDRPLPPAPTLPDRSRYAALTGRRGFLAGAAALAAGQALAQAPAGVPDGRPFRFFFEPEPGSTLAYEVTEAERQSGPPAASYLRWRHTLTLALGQPTETHYPATLTISGVAVEDGKGSSLHLDLARLAEGRTLAVRLDRRSGFIERVVDWPSVKAELKGVLPTRLLARDAVLVPEILDRLDAVQGSTAIGRPLHLISGGYMMLFKPDGSPMTIPEWSGGAAYILPAGRTLTSKLGLHNPATGMFGLEWSLATDGAAAARHLGPEFRSLLAQGSDPDVRKARVELDKALGDGTILMEEGGRVMYEKARRVVVRYGSKLTLGVGPFRTERGVFAEIVPA